MEFVINPMEFVMSVFQSILEGTTILTNFLKGHICNKSLIEIHTLLAIFNNEELRNFKVKSSHTILKEMDDT